MTKRMAGDDPRRKRRERLGSYTRGTRTDPNRREGEWESRSKKPTGLSPLDISEDARKARFKELYPENKWRAGITCRMLHISHHRLYQWLAEDQAFAEWWRDEQVIKVESLEKEFDAVVEGEHGMPAIVGRIFRLKGEAPGKYRERGTNQGADGGRVRVELQFLPRAIEGEYRRLPSPAEEDQGTE